MTDGEQEHLKEHPTVAMDKEGNFVIAWSSSFYGSRNADIYAQRFSSDGNPIGLTFKVSDYLKYADHEHPAVARVDEGNFIITWCEAGDSDREIYAQLFSCNAMPVGKNFKVDNDRTYSGQQYPDMAADDSGNFVIVWSDGRYSGKDIFAQRYNRNGIPIDKNFKVNDDDERASVQWYPAVSMDEKGNFLITWYDNRNGDYDIFAQRFLNDGSAFGTNFQVATNNDELQELPDIGLRNNKVYDVWQDNHSGVSGYDVWANALLFNQLPKWISSDMATACEDSSFEYHASARDPEEFPIHYAFQSLPTWCNVSDSIVSGIPTEGAKDTSFMVIASDGHISEKLEVAIKINPINDPPCILRLSDFTFAFKDIYSIFLDTCVNDPDHSPEEMQWEVISLDKSFRVDLVNRFAIFFLANQDRRN